MVELVDILLGAVVGVLATVSAYLLQEKIRAKRRKEKIANLIIGEIHQHLSAIKIIHDAVMPIIAASDKRVFLSFATKAFFYSDRVLTAVSSEMMAAFPSELYFQILFYYKNAELLSRQLEKALEEEDKTVFEASFSGARIPVLDYGFRIIIRILEEVLNDVEKANMVRENLKLFGLEKLGVAGKVEQGGTKKQVKGRGTKRQQ